jgi:PAS domain S-box-containing protein
VKILVVEDRAADMAALRAVLDDPGYEVVGAASGPEALRHLLRDEFAVIVLDVMLPEMSGFELARLVKQHARSHDTPIVFLTAAGADSAFIAEAYSLGAVDYLHKPIEPLVLRSKVAVFAELARKERRIQAQEEELRAAARRRHEIQVGRLQARERTRYQALADALPLPLWTAGPDGSVQHANRAWREYTGLEEARAFGWAWLDVVHPHDRERLADGWRGALAEQLGYRTECRVLRGADDEWRWHIVDVVPDLEDSGALGGWVATFADIDDLQRAIEARDEFLAVASHELRNPLQTLKLGLELVDRALQQSPLPHEGVRKLTVVHRQFFRLSKLVDALVDVSRISRGISVIEPAVSDLAAVVRAAVDRREEEAVRNGSALRVSAPDSLMGYWDPRRLEQVVDHLLSNAIRHGQQKPIDVVLARHGDDVCLVVEDRGPGIDPALLPRLFAKLGTVRAPTPGGLSLGLFISREVVRQHGGEIEVDSDPSRSTRLIVRLPHRDAAG